MATATYNQPRLKQERALKLRLDLKSMRRPIESKCKPDVPPGQHGQRRGRAAGIYGQQLHAKQALRRKYGVLERQFKRYFKEAARRPGLTGENLLQILESRLNNVVYRMGFASTRAEARQMINHKAIAVQRRIKTQDNEVKYYDAEIVNISSYSVQPGDKIIVREKAKKHDRISSAMSLHLEHDLGVEWLEVDTKALEGIYKYHPERSQLPTDINEQLVVELYSK